MLRCAKDLGLKARACRSDWSRLAKTPLPAIATLHDGGFLLVAKATEDKVLVQSRLASRPALMTRAELLAVWDGRLILMARRAGLSDITRRFDITWFMGAIHKYRRLLGEVLVASFFLQMFALVSPLFFQVVIDKVLVHRGLSTLDVLIIGLLAISIFETVLGILRTYLFAHTTNRIDVELGARSAAVSLMDQCHISLARAGRVCGYICASRSVTDSKRSPRSSLRPAAGPGAAAGLSAIRQRISDRMRCHHRAWRRA
jgi:subfamily B ATP-binding cassette protein HlyB/CyaB